MPEWSLAYDGFDPENEGLREALCTLGNGYFATRGAAPEAAADGVHYPGTYVAGCFDRLDTEVAGRTIQNEDVVNAPNWLPLTFRVADGEWFDVGQVALLGYQQELDMHRGVLTRRLRFRDGAGRVTALTQRRLVSMDDPHLAALETTFLPVNWSGRLEVRATIDGRVTNSGVARYRDLAGRHLVPVAEGYDEPGVVWLQVQTATSGIRIAEAARLRVAGAAGPVTTTYDCANGSAGVDLAFDVERAIPVTVEKSVALYTSRDRAIAECLAAARDHAPRAPGFNRLLARHVVAWARLWKSCRTTIGGDPQRILNLHIFHLLQTTSEHTTELDVGVPARGLHGEAYRGHVFWDELLVFPFLDLRVPDVARALLMYRWRRLPAARRAAREAGYRGAMYPWQSGSDGRDETQRVHLNPKSGRWLPDNSRLQRHVGLAVAYNVWRHFQATGDLAFLDRYGAEMLVEIARFWCSLAELDEERGRYVIRGVMGPDEYHDAYPETGRPGIDNNTYTNVLAAWVVRRALDALDLLPEHRRAELRERLSLRQEELDRFEDVTRRMLVVFHDGMLSQFEGYEQLAELDWVLYREKYGDIRRLDRILEAEGDTVNRYQASKQADVVMLFFLLDERELTQTLDGLGYRFDSRTAARTIDYHLARTTHGSTLSAVVHAWVLARTDRRASWRFFLEALASDITDIQGGTTSEGIHLGAMAGTVDLVQRCYTGLAIANDVLYLDPRLPDELAGLDLTLRYRGHSGILLRCTPDRVRIELRPSSAPPITVAVDGHVAVLSAGESWEVPYPTHRPSDGSWANGLTATGTEGAGAARIDGRQRPNRSGAEDLVDGPARRRQRPAVDRRTEPEDHLGDAGQP